MLLQIFIIVSVFLFGSAEAGSRADFDGNGEVDFADFVLFAQAFESAEARFDLDGSGAVDFPDFVLFSSEFGKPIGAAKVGKTDEATQAELLRAAAKAYEESGNYPGAVESLKGMLALDLEPVEKAKGLRSLGAVHMAMGDLELATAAFGPILTEYRNSQDNGVRFQVLWSNIYLSHISKLQNKSNRAGLYLSQARLYLPNLETE